MEASTIVLSTFSAPASVGIIPFSNTPPPHGMFMKISMEGRTAGVYLRPSELVKPYIGCVRTEGGWPQMETVAALMDKHEAWSAPVRAYFAYSFQAGNFLARLHQSQGLDVPAMLHDHEVTTERFAERSSLIFQWALDQEEKILSISALLTPPEEIFGKDPSAFSLGATAAETPEAWLEQIDQLGPAALDQLR